MMLPQPPANGKARKSMERLQRILIEQAQTEALVTYKELADRLGLTPPQTIHQLMGLLEKLMADDSEAADPCLAALCVGRLRGDLPAPGFFTTAETLGLFRGDPEGPEARDFHERELARVFGGYHRSLDG